MCPVWLELSSYLSIVQSVMNFKAELFYVFLNFMASYIMSNWGLSSGQKSLNNFLKIK